MEIQIVKLHGRNVIVAPVIRAIRKFPCNDCGAEAIFLMTEIPDETPRWEASKEYPTFKSWFWCGHCDVGV